MRKELTLIQFFKKKQFILRGNNKAVMFVRAPKHFKSGKQKIFFFCGIYTKKFFLKSFFDYRWLVSSNNNNLVYSLNYKLNDIRDPNIYLSRLTYITTIRLLY